MSPGLTARPLGRFSVAPTTAIELDRQPQPRDRRDRLEHGGAAGHVELHLRHLRAGLQRDAAAVERHRLADEAERRRPPARRAVVAQRDQRGLLLGALRDRGERAHAARRRSPRGPRPRPAGRRSPRRAPARARRAPSGVRSLPGRFCRSRARLTASRDDRRLGDRRLELRPRPRGDDQAARGAWAARRPRRRPPAWTCGARSGSRRGSCPPRAPPRSPRRPRRPRAAAQQSVRRRDLAGARARHRRRPRARARA